MVGRLNVRVATLASRPTQFDAPFYRALERVAGLQHEVLYLGAAHCWSSTDAELGTAPDWQVDLFSGYAWRGVSLERLASQLKAVLHEFDLLFVPGWRVALRLLRPHGVSSVGERLAVRTDTADLARGTFPWTLARRLQASGLKAVHVTKFGVPGTVARDVLIRSGVAREGIVSYPYAVDTETFQPAPRERTRLRQFLDVEGEKVIFVVAKLIPREVPTALLELFDSRRTPRDWILIVAGDGSLRPRLMRRYSHLAQVRWLGYVKYTALPSYYAAADLFVHLPTEEPWGVSVGEALATGTRVLTSRMVGSSIDLIDGPAYGLYTSEGGERELEGSLHELLCRDRLSHSETTAWRSRHSLERYAEAAYASWLGCA